MGIKTIEDFPGVKERKQFDFSINGKEFEVYKFEATESIFSCFNLEVTLVSEHDLNSTDYVGKDSLFSILNHQQNRYFYGVISKLTFVDEMGRFNLYKATIIPHLQKLAYTSDVRVFQNKTTKEIVKQILEEHQIVSNSYKFRDHEKHTPREYCVQYRETNLEFISRLLSEEGMFYYFTFTKTECKVIFGDTFACHGDIPGDKTVKFSASGELTEQGEQEHITNFEKSEQLVTGKVTFRDYNFEAPSHKPESTKSHERYNILELYDYPGYLDASSSNTLRQDIALDRAIQDQFHVIGKSTCRRILPGHTFVLKDYAYETDSKEYIIVTTTHSGTQPQVLQEIADAAESNTYFNTFKCISGDVNFKPPKLKKPSVQGIQTAQVTGPSSEEIHVDEHGRIKAQFHWDRKGKVDENSSCWLRVAQPWAGSGWGTVFIPRIGQEVIVNFIDGDPDRPLVTGALYNGSNKPPYSLPEDKTRSTIKTRTTPGGGGFNELRFEDKKDEEEIYIHGQKDWNIEILNDKGQHIGHDEKMTVDNDRTKEVKHDQKETIGNNKDITVEKNHTEEIKENSFHTIGKNSDEHVKENKTIKIDKNRKETIKENSDTLIEKDETKEVKNNYTKSIGKDSKIDIGNDSTKSITGDSSFSVSKNHSMDITKAFTLEAGKDVSITSTGSDIILKTAGASITITSGGDINIKGANINMEGSGDINMKGSNINQN